MGIVRLFRRPALLVSLFLLLCLKRGYGQEFTFKSSEASEILTASQLYQHGLPDTITTWCTDWNTLTGLSTYTTWGNNFKFKSVNDFIKFYVNNYYYRQQKDYTYQLTYQVYGFSTTNPLADTTISVIKSDTLTISNTFYTDGHNAYQDINQAKYSGFFKTMVVITGIYDYTSGSPANLADTSRWNFNIESSILTQRYDKRKAGITFYGTGTSMKTTRYAHPANNYLSVYINVSAGDTMPVQLTPVNYELEWTYVDDYTYSFATGTLSTVSESSLNYDFRHNSTRVWLTDSKYNIPIVYNTGYIVYRVRTVRPDSNLFKFPIYGDWSYGIPDSGSISNADATLSSGAAVYQINSAYMNDSLNWQYTISFAEGGKFKHVLSFYDGLLKNRESITRFNSTPNYLIATKSIYDFEGRPCIKTLPAPVASTAFNFLHNVDLNAATMLPYKAGDFDTGFHLCPVDAALSPLDSTALASVYYSPRNPDTAGPQAFVPDAEGFPMVETIYSPAYNDRVYKQGGAGPRLQIADSNIITNYYVGADQQSLNRLFGENIGWSSYYTKTISSDPNQQLSMSIKSYQGKQVASSMIGRGGDPTTHAITPIDAPDSIYFHNDILYGLPQEIIDNRRIADNDFFNEATGTDSIQYIYKFAPYPVCPAESLSVKAHYFYVVSDQCGDTVAVQDSTLGITGVVTSGVAFSGSVNSMFLQQGPYHVHKELSINEGDIDAALDSFFDGPNCLLTEPYFIRKAVESRTFPCPASFVGDPCAEKKWEMEQELHPNAKYGHYSASGGGMVIGTSNSIFTRYLDSVIAVATASSYNHTSDSTSGGSIYCFHYRYQDSCTAFSLPDSLMIAGVMRHGLRTMSVDSFILLYNESITDTSDPIAEALLPLHPEYCEWLHCFNDTFKTQLLALPTAQVAQGMHLLYLDSIIAADPAVSYLSSFANPSDSLATYPGGRLRLDSMELVKDYCGCGDSVMMSNCTSAVFSYEIQHRLLVNDFVKNQYFADMISLYLQNRQRFIDATINAAGDSCWHCSNVRMTLIPSPVFPTGTATTGLPTPTIVDSSWGSTRATWLLSAFSSLPAVDSAADSALIAIEDSAALIYSSADSLLGVIQADSIVAHLANCGNGDTTIRNGIRNTLDSLVMAHAVSQGNYTPDQVRFAILRNGATLNDFCNPYLIGYINMSLAPSVASQACLPDIFYESVADFLNDSAVNLAFRNLGTIHLDTVDMTPGTFGNNVGTVTGNPEVGLFVTYNSVKSLYTLSVYHDPSVGGSPDTVHIYLRGTGGCGASFYGGDSARVTDVECISTAPSPVATGYINEYSFLADVTNFFDTTATTCQLLGWTDTVQSMTTRNNILAACIPCTQMKQVYTRFMDSMTVLGMRGVDHPYYETMLQSFLDYYLGSMYSSTQYENFINSCAFADSMLLPLYIGYSSMKFSTVADADSFKAMMGRLDSNVDVNDMYSDSSSTGIILAIDFNMMPPEEMWLFRNAIDTYSGPFVTRMMDTSLYYLLTTGTGPQLGFLYVAPGTTLPSMASIMGTSAYMPAWAGPYHRGIWMGTHFQLQDFYIIHYSSSPPPYIYSQQSYLLQQYIYNHSLGATFYSYYQNTCNKDYYKIQKQEYLHYTYSYERLAPYAVLDSVQSPYLVSRISGYSADQATYQMPSDPSIVTNLYLSDGTTNRLYDTLGHILEMVKDSNIINPGHLFLNTPAFRITHDSSLYAYQCSDGTYWYRYFGTGDTLWNVYVAMPPWIPHYLHSSYHVSNIGLPFPGVTPSIADSTTRFFSVSLISDSGADTLQARGMCSFVIANNVELDNVLLGNPISASSAPPPPDTFENCERDVLNSAIRQGIRNYDNYMDSARAAISAGFMAWMLDSVQEELLLSYVNQEFGYTLYYYDRAGNLINTVPPAGIVPLGMSQLDSVDTARQADNVGIPTLFPNHNKVSSYAYNTLNQVVNQSTPDGGATGFWYDYAGRLILSQNARQASNFLKTYNLYDKQNRIIETGELMDTVTNLAIKPMDSVIAYVHATNRDDVVMTIYDTAAFNLGQVSGLDSQQKLRHRVATVKYFENIVGGDSLFTSYSYATHYSYDIDGNVKTLTQDFPALAGIRQQYKRIDYDYDLISGKVNMLSYNRSFADQYYQQYSYDEDNRITQVQTSADGYIWHQDAAYTYYEHGPLARIDVGDLRVQGIDYAYTIQGWLKMVNGDSLNTTMDMGQDGLTNVNANDAVAMTIDYFKNDYKPITSAIATRHVADPTLNLYNGNISGQTVAMTQPSNSALTDFYRLNKQYIFDQLNRIHSANYAGIDPANHIVPVADYKNSYTYDPDGNLQTLLRNGSHFGVVTVQPMDNLRYTYGTVTDGYSYNQLKTLNDTATNVYTVDLQKNISPTPNYLYDAIGNTTKDLVSGQDTIEWNLYNKVVKTINVNGSSMQFKYDGAGNRVAKYSADASNNQNNDYYVHDAQGNILAIYHEQVTPAGPSLTGIAPYQYRSFSLSEHDIYGSSRLGVKKYWGPQTVSGYRAPAQMGLSWDYGNNLFDTVRLWQRQPWYSLDYQDDITDTVLSPFGNAYTGKYIGTHITGLKQYEFTDHLGDVMATISDARGTIGAGALPDSFLITSYTPVLQSETDYYPFGMVMPGRNTTDSSVHCENVTATVDMPVHNFVTIYWPDGHETAFGGATVSVGASPLVLTAPGAGGGLHYTLTPATAGITQTLQINFASTPPLGFTCTLVQSGGTIGSGVPTSTTMLITYTPTSTAPITLTIQKTLFPPATLKIKSIVKDSISYTPEIVVTKICNEDGYEYGFNGKYKDNNWAGSGNHLDYGFRGYDPRVVRFNSVDLLTKKFPWYTPYQFAGNSPILNTDVDGLEPCSYDIRSRQIETGYLKGKVSKDQLIAFYNDNGKAAVLGGAILIDNFVTHGRITSFVWSSYLWGTQNHNESSNPEVAAKQQNTARNGIINGVIGFAVGKVVGYGLDFLGGYFSKEIGNWVSENTNGWSSAAKEYQEYVTGVPAGTAYKVNGVNFDGFKNGVLQEAKSSYDNFVAKDGNFQSWFAGKESLLDQARRQLQAADGVPIEWNFSSQKTLDATKKLFEKNKIKGIKLKYKPKK